MFKLFHVYYFIQLSGYSDGTGIYYESGNEFLQSLYNIFKFPSSKGQI